MGLPIYPYTFKEQSEYFQVIVMTCFIRNTVINGRNNLEGVLEC